MTQVVLKYPLRLTDVWQRVDMPVGAKVVLVGSQMGTICLWALAAVERDDLQLPKEARYFAVHGTGHLVQDDRTFKSAHVGSCFLDPDGTLVWHVFERVSDGR